MAHLEASSHIFVRLTRAMVLSVALSSAACAGGDAPDSDRTLVIPWASSHWSMSPGADDTPRRLVFQHMVIYESLWCGDPVGEIAEHWEHNDDLTEWTLHLRPDNRWHDGVPVTARDIQFTLELWRHPEVQYWYGAHYESSEIIDDQTIRIRFNQPARMLLDGWIVYYPAHLLEDLDPAAFYQWDFWVQPVGNGPFRYVRHVPSVLTEYAPNPEYHRGPPGVDRLILRYGESTLPQLLAGDIDMLIGVSPIEAMRVEDDARFRVYHEEIPGARYLVWNVDTPLFESAEIRRALTMAIDRRSLHRTLGWGDQLPVTDGIYTACQYVRRDLPDPHPFAPDSARILLERAGWVDRDGDGVRERDGTPFRFAITVGGELNPQAAVFVQDQLSRVGVEAEVAQYEGTVVRDRYRSGDYDAVIFGAAGDGWSFVEGAFGADRSLTWQDDTVVSVLEEASRQARLDRDDEVDRANEILLPEMPFTWLYPGVQTHIVPADLEGLRDDRGPLAYLWNASLPPR